MIALDVGANNGSDSIRLANSGYTVHAFEPAPAMYLALAGRADKRIVANQLAVSDFDGTATMNLSEQWDHGCSSLLEFRRFAELEANWPGRLDLRPTGTEEVRVTRLDTYLREQGIEQVDYLHCDAQGNDLRVLQGLGDYTERVMAGVVEGAVSREVAIYQDQPLALDLCRWLTAVGFAITSIRANDVPRGNEVNIEFRR